MNIALTSLNFLDKGESFPPPSQSERLEDYRINEAKFSGVLNIDKKGYGQFVQLIGNKFNVVSYNTLINFYRLVSKKTADLLSVEPPDFVSDTAQDTVDEIVKNSNLKERIWESAIDADSKGTAIITARLIDEKGTLGVSQPKYWYPVVNPIDAKEILYHVMAWVVTLKDDNGDEKKELFYQIHEKGQYTEGVRDLDSGVIGDLVGEEIVHKTGFSSFAIATGDNITTTSSVFGISSYHDMYSLIDELQIRFEKIKHVLDKHSDPSMAGPTEALTFDEETGKYYFEIGQFYEENPDNKGSLRYITWDGKLEGSFREIEKIINLLAVISEMGAALFDLDGQSKELSGIAIRLLYTNALTKVRRIRNKFDATYKHMVEMVSEVGYKTPVTDLSITWHDGLPNDPKEDAEIAAIRTGGKATDSQVSQIRKLDGLSEDDARARLAEINEENKARMSTMPTDETEFFETE